MTSVIGIAYVDGPRLRRFCTELLVRGLALPSGADVRAALRPLGGPIVVLRTGDLLKAHVHTDTPDAVFALGRAWGTLESTKAEDMRAQHRAIRNKLAVVVVAATTSQPGPQAFEEAYADALRQGHHVIVVVLSSRLSGTHASAEAAARRVDPEGRRITVVAGGARGGMARHYAQHQADHGHN